ncbi:MAG TPA: SOS response-associated peptidase [Pyrinomonadaceae bacterium]|jgi:putative SOS response-associated peptidase YedK
MCGRFTLRQPAERIAREFQLEEIPALEARYNIAPTQDILAIRHSPDGKEAGMFKWGLIPSWAKDASIGAKLINARSETVGEKPSFREAFKRRRCIIPVDGFYEWQRTGNKKQPYYFHFKDNRLFGFAGLWEKWRTPEGKSLESCSILTTEANEVLSAIHHRMPVILHPDTYDLWLDEDERNRDSRKELLRPYPASGIVSYAVSKAINSPRHQGEELAQPIDECSVGIG